MKKESFKIELLDIHWLKDSDEQTDLCAHGQVKVTVGNEIIVDRQGIENHWTLSAMAMHLLRTLEKNHVKDDVVGEHLIPCCGHHIDHLEEELDVHIQGCFTGVNYWVEHQGDNLYIATENECQIEIEFKEYKTQILNFADEIEQFYKQSKPKILPEDDYDRKGYQMFWQEWNRRKAKWAN